MLDHNPAGEPQGAMLPETTADSSATPSVPKNATKADSVATGAVSHTPESWRRALDAANSQIGRLTARLEATTATVTRLRDAMTIPPARGDWGRAPAGWVALADAALDAAGREEGT